MNAMDELTVDELLVHCKEAMNEGTEACRLAAFYAMYARALSLERELEEAKAPTVMVETRGGVTAVGVYGLANILYVDYDNLEAALGDEEADEAVASDLADMREWAELEKDKELAAQADEYEKKHKELKKERE